ncbi:MAG: DsrH/TusB family sulfur metabolism protein [Candidatus Helarchaeota archaeon]
MTKILVMIDDNEFKELAYNCIETIESGCSGVLLLQNGAYLSIISPDREKIQEFINNKIPVYGIFRDFMLRGIEEKVEKYIELIDYNEFINLIMIKYDKVISFV